MTTGSEVIVLRDGDGHYYLLPQAVLDAARVPESSHRDLEGVLGGQALSDEELETVAGGAAVSGLGSLQASAFRPLGGFFASWVKRFGIMTPED